MTGKQRAGLRAMANTIQPIFQIGKGGIGDTMIEQIGMALVERRLHMLDAAHQPRRKDPHQLARRLSGAQRQRIDQHLELLGRIAVERLHRITRRHIGREHQHIGHDRTMTRLDHSDQF